MKVEIEIDAGAAGKTLQEILTSLTPEEKRKLAEAAMQQWMSEPFHIEREMREAEILSSLRAREPEWSKNMSDSEIRRSWRWEDALKGWRSSREQMVQSIKDEIVAHYKMVVKQIVESDPKIQAMKEEVVKIVMETYPKAVHEALTLWCASGIAEAVQGVGSMSTRAQNLEAAQAAISDRLMQIATQFRLPG